MCLCYDCRLLFVLFFVISWYISSSSSPRLSLSQPSHQATAAKAAREHQICKTASLNQQPKCTTVIVECTVARTQTHSNESTTFPNISSSKMLHLALYNCTFPAMTNQRIGYFFSKHTRNLKCRAKRLTHHFQLLQSHMKFCRSFYVKDLSCRLTSFWIWFDGEYLFVRICLLDFEKVFVFALLNAIRLFEREHCSVYSISVRHDSGAFVSCCCKELTDIFESNTLCISFVYQIGKVIHCSTTVCLLCGTMSHTQLDGIDIMCRRKGEFRRNL